MINVYIEGLVSHNKSYKSSKTQNIKGNDNMINSNEASSANNYSVDKYNFNVYREKKLKKRGRTVAFYLNNNFSNDAWDKENLPTSNFYNSYNMVDGIAVLDLRKRINDFWCTLQLNAIYTEPLSSRLSLILDDTLNNEQAHVNKSFYGLLSTVPTPFS